MERILIIGGAGYVGSVATEYFLSKNYNVRVFDNFTYKNSTSVLAYITNSNYEFVFGDLKSSYEIAQILENVDYVLILAGLVGDPITKKYPKLSIETNEDAIENLIKNINNKGIKKVIFVSTCSNYGLMDTSELADENYPLNPLSSYANSKVKIEKFIENTKNNYDFAITILRFATAFGLSPRMRFDLTISEFVLDMFLGKELLVFDENTWRPYCHVKDFAILMEKVLISPNDIVNGQVFNAGGDSNNFTKKMIVDTIRKYIPEAKIKYQEHGSDPRNYRVNFMKVKNALKFEPLYSVEYGIEELIYSLQNHCFDSAINDKSNYGNYNINE